MDLVKRYIFFFLLFSLISCGKNEFNLDFDLSKDITDNYNVTYYATDVDGGKTVQAVASVREGVCQLKCVTKRPTVCFLTSRKSGLPLVIYASRGEKITIDGDGAEPLEWKVEGNDINKSMSEWRAENISVLLHNNTDSINNAVRNYVEENSGNPVSTLLMLSYFDRAADERGYEDLMASLNGKAKEDKWLILMGRTDQLYHNYFYPARLQSMIQRSHKGGTDTVAVDGKNPVILLFWQSGYTERKELMDSIKVLTKDYPDSVRIIADACLDVDSLEWRRSLRRDSLDDKIKRLWIPYGLTDPAVTKLKVTNIPYFIVFDREGYQSYRGKDLSAAMKEYRSLLKDSL